MYIDYYKNENVEFDFTLDVVFGVLYKRTVDENFLTLTTTGEPTNSLGEICSIDGVLLDTYLSKLRVSFGCCKREGIEVLLTHYEDMIRRIER